MYYRLDQEIVKYLRNNGPRVVGKMRPHLNKRLGKDFTASEIYNRCEDLQEGYLVEMIEDDKGFHIWHATPVKENVKR